MRLVVILISAYSLAACFVQESEQADSAFPYFSEEGGRVRDMAEVLEPVFEADLTTQLDEAEAHYGYQMGVVTVDSLHDYSIEDFSLEYARAWGLGDAARNDGLLILLAPSERKVRIEVGLGVEGSFTDEFCQEIIDDHMLPHFRAINYEAGLAEAVTVMIGRMRSYPTIPANDNETIEAEAEDAA